MVCWAAMRNLLAVTLVLAAAGLAACGGGQPAAKKDAPPAAGAAANVPAPLLALLPAKDEVPGWAFSKAPRAFNPDNLFELIDGAADGFVAYGVQQMVTADYTQAGTGYQAVIEAYQMKDPLNAFGKYSEERSPDSQFLEVGNEGYSGGTSVNFWAGQFYVKVTTFEDKEPIRQEILKLAKAVAGKVSTPGAAPAELAWFPKENQVPHTAKYIPKDVLAQSYLANGFEAKYKGGAKDHKVVVIGADDAAAARESLTRYRQSVEKSGKGVKTIAAPGEGGFVGRDSFYGNVVAVRSGKTIVVSLGAPTEDVGRKQLAEVVRNIR
jgi:hypothetical protein